MDQKTRNRRILLGMKGLRVLFESDDSRGAQKIIQLINAIAADPDNKKAFVELDKLVKAYAKQEK